MTGLTGNNAITGAGYRKNQPPYEIDQSLRFDHDSSSRLTKTFSSSGNRKINTLSFWIKPSLSDTRENIFAAAQDDNNRQQLYFFNNTLRLFGRTSGSNDLELYTNQVFRDPSAWYHIVISMDSTQSTAANRVKIYVNGEQVTSFSTETYWAQDYSGWWASDKEHSIATDIDGGSYAEYFGGYLAEVNFIDGQALTPASFGDTLASTNQWVPIEYTGSYGTNGFYQKYSATELANSFTDSGKSAIDSSDRESEIAVTSSFTWAFTSSGNTDGEDLVNGLLTNDDAGGGWMPSGDVTDRWIKFDFGSGKVYTKCQWITINSNSSEGTWKWQGSNNDSDWTDIGGTFTLGGDSRSGTTTYTLGDTLNGNTTSYRYYRILGTTGSANTSGRRLAMYFGGWSDGVGHTITANGDVTNTRAQSKIGESSIKFDGSGDYLSCADSSDWDFLPASGYTAEAWYKPITHAGTDFIIGQSVNGNNYWMLGHEDGAGLRFESYSGGSLVLNITGGEITDTDWHHIAVVRDGSDVEIFKDGTSVATGTTSSTATFAGELRIGEGSAHGAMDGYLDEIRLSNTARYTSSFTPSTTAFTPDSNTKLLIHSDFDGGLGADSSGNTNDFTPTNLVATDQVPDSPTNNFATLNPVSKGDAITLSEGNLKFTDTSYDFCHATIQGMDKVYFEVCQLTNRMSIGVVEPTQPFDGSTFATNAWIIYSKADTNSIQIWNDNSQSHEYTGLTLDTNGVLSFKIDFTTGNIYAWDTSGTAVNSGNSLKTFGTAVDWQLTTNNYGDAQSGIFNFGQDSSFAGTVTAQGNQDGNGIGDFYRAVPSDYLAMCTDNLPDPSIADPTANFNTLLYTGTGSEHAVTGVGFEPDFVWIKRRTPTGQNHLTINSVMGASLALSTSLNTPEYASYVTSIDSDGFTLADGSQQHNGSGNPYASWNWKAGGTASSNTDGSITSSVSANTDAGFSVLTYTGTGSNATVGHGLSQVPEHIILKRRDGSGWSWYGYNETTGNTKSIYLNSTATPDTDSTFWNDTSPTSSVFTVGTANGINQSSGTYVAWCFHSVDGYSKIGSYTGNGSTDGTFVYTGFRPAFVMIKRYDSSSGANWILLDSKRDTFNVVEDSIYANLSNAEEDVGRLDFVSNGFKLRQNGTTVNTSSGTYIYLAISESPFKTSNAR